MTPYKKHKKKWIGCKKCILHKGRTQVVLARGKLPADVLFIGEAPGVSEDVLGTPFIGPAGKLLDRMIEEAFSEQCRVVMTNLVACIPRDKRGDKVEEPPEKCIQACALRLTQFIKLANPDLVVYVGKLPEKWASDIVESLSGRKVLKTLKIIHPAAILRMDVSQRGLAIQRTVVRLRDAAEQLAPF